MLWVEALICFAAFSTTATERNLMQAQVFQIVRDNRLLQQQVMDQQAKIVEQAGMMDLFIRHVPAAVAMLDDRLEPMMLSQRWIREFGDPASGEETGVARSPLHVPEIEAALGLARRLRRHPLLGQHAARVPLVGDGVVGNEPHLAAARRLVFAHEGGVSEAARMALR